MILSDIPAHREVAGDHATYVEVGNIDALAEQMRRIAADPSRIRWNVARTWQDNATEMLDVFDEAMEDRSRADGAHAGFGQEAAAPDRSFRGEGMPHGGSS
jgi:hypothetical protein